MVDVSSGVETDRKKDFWKVRTVTRLVKRKLPAYFGPFGGQYVPEILPRAPHPNPSTVLDRILEGCTGDRSPVV